MRSYLVCVFSVFLLLNSSIKAELEEVIPVDGIEQIEEQIVSALKNSGLSQEDLDVVDELVANAEIAGGFWDKEFFQKNKKAIKIGAAIATGAIVVGGGAWYFLPISERKDEKKVGDDLGSSFEDEGGEIVRKSRRLKKAKAEKSKA